MASRILDHKDYKACKKQAYHPGYNDKDAHLTSSQKMLCVVSLILPPLAVAMHTGVHHHFWIDVVLTILGFIPGVIYGIIVIVSHKPSTYSTKKTESFQRY